MSTKSRASAKRNSKKAMEIQTSEDDKQPLTGALKVKKNVPKATIQTAINQQLYETIPISAFIQETINTMVKNTVGIHCRKCNSDNVYSMSRQTRSADEAMTVFYTCLNCGNKWKIN